MESYFSSIASYVALALELASVVMVALGGIEAAWHAFRPLFGGRSVLGARRTAWLSLARWLLLGLEFMLAADIVRTAISPDWTAIGQLGAIAVIRTFLNYFLERDLEALSSREHAT